MNANRWFRAVVSAGVLSSSFMFVAPVFSQHKPGHDHNENHDPKNTANRIEAALAKLPKTDRTLADEQRYCPIMDTVRLGAIGTPVKIMIEGKPVFLCCHGCQDEAVKHGKDTLEAVAKLKKATMALAKLPAADQPLAEAQLFCAVADGSRLGSMGTPVKLILEGEPVFLCCKGCIDSARSNPKATVAKVRELKISNTKAGHGDGDSHPPQTVPKPAK